MFREFRRTLQTGAAPGQAIVIMAMAMVALLAVLGLAIDGGGLLLLQRNAQNATDAAVLAATYVRCTNAEMDPELLKLSAKEAAWAAAAANGFNNDGVSNTVTLNFPPLSGTGAGDEDFMEVIINAKKPPYFIQLVYQGPLEVTVRAIGYCSPPFDPATVPALWAGSRTCQDTMTWSGSESRVEGGIFSNNEIKFGGGGHDNDIIGGAEAVTVVQTSAADNATFDPAPVEGVEPQAYPVAYRLRDFKPDGTVTQRVLADGGYYTWITDPSNIDPDFRHGDWTPANGRELRGVYYVEGDVTLDGNHNIFHSDGVTIVATGEIKGSGGANWRYYIDGLLIYSDYESTNCGDKGVDVSGESIWYGVVFAPRAGVGISGNHLTIYGAIIANTIDIHGSDLLFQYDPTLIPPRPPLVQVAE